MVGGCGCGVTVAVGGCGCGVGWVWLWVAVAVVLVGGWVPPYESMVLLCKSGNCSVDEVHCVRT